MANNLHQHCVERSFTSPENTANEKLGRIIIFYLLFGQVLNQVL